MTFYTIDQTHTQDAIAEAVVHREMELFSYDMNIDNYETMLAALPAEAWPENLIQYKNATPDQVPDELDAVVADFQFRDRLRGLLKTEKIERSKANRIYQALVSRLPEDTRASLIAEAHARIQASQQG